MRQITCDLCHKTSPDNEGIHEFAARITATGPSSYGMLYLDGWHCEYSGIFTMDKDLCEDCIRLVAGKIADIFKECE